MLHVIDEQTGSQRERENLSQGPQVLSWGMDILGGGHKAKKHWLPRGYQRTTSIWDSSKDKEVALYLEVSADTQQKYWI